MNERLSARRCVGMAVCLMLLAAAMTETGSAVAMEAGDPERPAPDTTPDEQIEPASAPLERWDPKQALELRNPFLPPGFRAPPRGPHPADPDAVEPERPAGPSPEQWEAARAALLISGISRRGEDMAALVNGRVVAVGDIIEVFHDGHLFRWNIESIGLRTGLELRPLDEEEPGERP